MDWFFSSDEVDADAASRSVYELVLPMLVVSFVTFVMMFLRRQRPSIHLRGLRPDVTIDHVQAFELLHNSFSVGSTAVRITVDEKHIACAEQHLDIITTGRYQTLQAAFLDMSEDGMLPVLLHDGHPVNDVLEIMRYIDLHGGGKPALSPRSSDKKQLAAMDEWLTLASREPGGPFDDAAKVGVCLGELSMPLYIALMQSNGSSYGDLLLGLMFHNDRSHPWHFLLLKLFGVRLLSLPFVKRSILKARTTLQSHLDRLEQHLEQVSNASSSSSSSSSSSAPAPETWICGSQFTLADAAWMAVLHRIRQLDLEDLMIRDGKHLQLEAYWIRLQVRESYRSAVLTYVPECVTKAIETVASWRASKTVTILWES